jgi:hypothetical protein
MSVAVHRVLRAAAINCDGCRPGSAVAGYSRKTARGASSPAKPALHIPELAKVSSSPSYQSRAALPSVVLQLVGGAGADAANADNPTAAGMAMSKIGGLLTHCR